MTSRVFVTLAGLALTLWSGSACGAFPAQSVQSPTSSGKTSPSPVATPAGFPADFPNYPGAHLSEAATFSSSGSTSWALAWQTVDGASKVQTFFALALKSGDWTLVTSSGTATTSFSSTFKRKSDANVTGTLGVAAEVGVTKITLVLTTVP